MVRMVRRRVRRRFGARAGLPKKKKAVDKDEKKTPKKHDVRRITVDGVVTRIDLTVLENKMANGCAHNSYTYYYGNKKKPKGNETCTVVGNKLLTALNAGVNIPVKYLNKYMSLIFSGNGTSYWTRRIRCAGRNQLVLSKIIYELLAYYYPTPAMLKRISTYSDGYYFKTLKGITLNEKFTKFDTQFVINYIKSSIKNCDLAQCSHSNNLNFLLSHTVMNQQIFDYLLECRCSHAVNIVLDILNDVYDPKYDDFGFDDNQNNDGENSGSENESDKEDDNSSTCDHDDESDSNDNDESNDELNAEPVDGADDTQSDDYDQEDADDNNSGDDDQEDDKESDDDQEDDNESDDDQIDAGTNIEQQSINDEPLDISKLISYSSLYAACRLLPKSAAIVECIIKRGFPVDSKCLEIVCEYCDEEAIKFILDYNVPVERVHFRNVINSKKYVNSNTYRKVGHYANNGFNMNKAELLFQSGYRMDYDDIIHTIDNRIVITDIERFGIPLDNSIYEYCHKNKFYPDYKFELTDRLQLELQRLCNGKSLNKIKQFIKDNNLKPDQKCMHFATKISGNFDVICYLIDSGCIMDTESTKNFIKGIWGLVSGYRSRGHQPDVTRIIDTIELTMNAYKDGVPVPMPVKVDDQVTVTVDANANAKSEPALIDIDGYNDDDINEIVDTMNTINLDVEVPKNIKRKINTPKLYAKYFGKDVDSKISFTKIKKELLTTIQTKKWVSADNSQLINLPADLRTELGIQQDGMIHLDDIDKVVALFYK